MDSWTQKNQTKLFSCPKLETLERRKTPNPPMDYVIIFISYVKFIMVSDFYEFIFQWTTNVKLSVWELFLICCYFIQNDYSQFQKVWSFADT